MVKNNLSEWQIELKKHIKQNRKTPTFITTLITPDDADFLLEDNEHNRFINQKLINIYLDFMNNGQWLLNGECLKIGSNGLLLDGQHRLLALQKHGQPLEMSVALGINPDTFAVNDTGLARSSGDILKIAGYKNSNQNAAGLRWLIMYQRSETMSIVDKIAPFETLKAIKQWPVFTQYVYSSRGYSHLCQNSFIQFFMYLTHFIDEELSYEFFAKLKSGTGLGKTSSILHLREMLLKYRSKSLTLDKRHIAASFFITWNAFIEKNRVSTVKWGGSDFPVLTGINRKKLFKPHPGYIS